MTTSKCILSCDAGGTRINFGLVHAAKLLPQTEIDAEAKRGLAAALNNDAGMLGVASLIQE